MSQPSKCLGFTLIELLIVVAIIAILALIAVPNFLDAQIRAKVSRVMADERSVAVALEAYCVDHQQYPLSAIPVWLPGGGVALSPKILKLIPLTTPVAYITKVPIDIFHAKRHDPAHGSINYQDAWSYFASDRYINDIPARAGEINHFFEYRGFAYYVIARGPTGLRPYTQGGIDERILYDPTNGTISLGNIARLGP